jgi:hypothetical protein
MRCRYVSMRSFLRALTLVSLQGLWIIPASHALATSAEDIARDYLIQKVCLDQSGKVQAIDPYNCPPDGKLRSLEPGEGLPYHRYDQPVADKPNSRQRHDSYPVTARDGQEVVVNPFDHAPFEQFKPNRDGYDLTMVREGWTSVGGTRSRNLGTTFFGPGCKPYGGWVFFPVSDLDGHLIKPGEARIPIKGDHWESNGEPWPGRCPSNYETDSVTSWEPLPGFKFGGPSGASTKTIDAIRSIHGFKDSPEFSVKGHTEVFYFTYLYGLTRWESWAPKERYDDDPSLRQKFETANERCNGPAENVYKGMTFERIDCRDWTAIDVLAKPEAPPLWPVPNLK